MIVRMMFVDLRKCPYMMCVLGVQCIYICIILHILCIYTHVYIILCVKQCFVGVSETCRLTLKIYLFVFVLFMDTN